MIAANTVPAAARGLYHLVPATFEARGATVPFTTPTLAHSRVRKDWRNRFELVIVGFYGGSGDYVLPWPTVSGLLSLTAHDTMLHRELQGRETLGPDDVRQVALEVAKTGLAGPDVSDAASRALAADDEAKAVTEVMLMLGLIKEIEPERHRELAADMKTTSGQARIREAFHSLAGRLWPNPESCVQRLSELTRSSHTVGLPDAPFPGRVRQSLFRLAEFQRSVELWGSERLGVTAEDAAFCAKRSGHTVKLGAALLAEFDSLIAEPRKVLGNWTIDGSKIERLADRLAWLVDGWDTISETWLGAADDDKRIDVLSEIVPILPVLPRNEAMIDAESGHSAAGPGVGRRWVHTTEDWRTGEPDPEMVERLEALKAKTL
jgi:hypothetical protein